ncbi:hypothetical protein DK762_03500 [Salmonella enterica subsp. houtenae]|nr:hypothetical protein [Salmonella enterica subsp. houtenae]ECI3705920.1 hypothetical protein [Salmonella enterica subsp. houtenae]MLR86377.1 hypothetical protein [Salmonella enterica subsp. houtenae]
MLYSDSIFYAIKTIASFIFGRFKQAIALILKVAMPVWPHDDVRKHSGPKRHQKQIIIKQ